MKPLALLILSVSMCLESIAQSVTPSVVAAAGGTGTAGSAQLDWTLGETTVTTIENGSNSVTQGFHQGDPVKVRLNIAALLQGAYNGPGAMRDDLRQNGLIPLTEPYTALGHVHVGGGGETIDLAVLAVANDNAIVDWIFLELRDKNDNTSVVATRSALLQADGDIVDTDGTSPVSFATSADDYYVSVQHRNHLSIISFSTVALTNAPTTVNFKDGSMATYGLGAQHINGPDRMLWSGDVSNNGVVQYTGLGNDRDPILVEIGGSVPTNTTTGYKQEDVNMDGTIQYTGLGNDRDPILVNIGGSVPSAVRIEQMP